MPLESTVERSLSRYVQKLGGTIIKIYRKRGWPDRIVVPDHGVMFYVECKQPKKQPRPEQVRNHAALRRMGYSVIVFDGTSYRALYTLMHVRRKITVHVNKERPNANLRTKPQRTARRARTMR